MKQQIKNYFHDLKALFDRVIATGNGNKIYAFNQAIEMAVRLIDKQGSSAGKLIFIGNGASASISSHMATDFWKNGNIPALAFNDSSLLTCVSNDYGYEYVFEKPLEMFATPQDILIAISSSGRSKNIIRAVKKARLKGLSIITLSGFKKDNPLRRLGDLNFYVPDSRYGHVENVHSSICHCLVDSVISLNNKKNTKR